MPGFEGRENAVKDLEGSWWYQDLMTASWYIWNGQEWLWIPGASPRVVPQTSNAEAKASTSWPCLITSLTGMLFFLVVVGGITLVAYNFFPAYYITPGEGDVFQILKVGGGGLLVTSLGFFMTYAGFKTFFGKATGNQQKSRSRRGCGDILNGIGRLFFGLLFLLGGLGMVTVVFFQEVLPWFGF